MDENALPEPRTTTTQDETDLGGSPAAVRLEDAENRLREGAHDPSDPDAPRPKEAPPAPEDAPAKGSPEFAWASMNRQLAEGKAQMDRLIAENEELQGAREELRRSGAQGMAPAQPQALGALAERIASMTGDDAGQVAQSLRDAIFEVVGPAANQLFGVIGDGAIEKERAQARKDDPEGFGIWGPAADRMVSALPPQVRLHPGAYKEAMKWARADNFEALVEREVQRRMHPGAVVGQFDKGGRFSESAAPGSFGEEPAGLSDEQSGWIKREIRDPAQAARIAGRVEQIRQERESRSRPKRSGGGGF